MDQAPVLFISHGAPTFALEPGQLGARLQALGARLPAIRAVLAVSAHWQTRDLRVMTSPAPTTLYDFRGFPDALYQLSYPAPGAPELAARAARLLVQHGYSVSLDAQRCDSCCRARTCRCSRSRCPTTWIRRPRCGSAAPSRHCVPRAS